ncbi:DUF1919 domain-containing protein [Ruminococcus sp.]|uniref:DUF1919 domain-containing protein n=1 Tax=Ruminococcus sp. TaxID=41978 RepID=UPI0025D2E1B0|nr:DUF1919 domain-containing protein [Ruminococcus sp.]MBQ6250264.1 DUF1919 domain-containing protein [Ruminococcus sp.]MBR6995401.1 DUF1919 domain-containing protein [Ruminococcus sp.]
MLTKAQIKRRLKAVVARFRRIGLHNTDFTIISNNCWGGCVYDQYGLQYRTPTIGLWMGAEDYIKFISDLDRYLNSELVQISCEEFHLYSVVKARHERGKYDKPLSEMVFGRLDDVDIFFLHYSTFEEAKQKWDRRKKRIDRKNIIYKFNDQNCFEKRFFEDFSRIDGKKLFFTCDEEYKGKENAVVYPEATPAAEGGGVVDDTDLSRLPFDLKEFLNSI